MDTAAVTAANTGPGPSLPVWAIATLLSTPGTYNPAASLPPKVVKKVLELEFVEMSDLRADESMPANHPHSGRRTPAKPPVTEVRVWLECYARMAALLVTRFPEKRPELWTYQSTITKAAHNDEGSNWVTYDHQFRREMLARKDLNWSFPNARLYNEAFTGRAKSIPRCPHCLGDDHSGATCPFNPSPIIIDWLQDNHPLLPSSTTVTPFLQGKPSPGTSRAETPQFQ